MAVLGDATLIIPETTFAHSGGRSGKRHSEHLGHLLTQMQWLQRAYPGPRGNDPRYRHSLAVVGSGA